MYGGAKSVAGVDFGQKSSGQHGRSREGVVAVTGCAGVGVAAIRAGGYLPVRPLEAVKLWQARTFAAAELAPSMTLKSYWVQTS